MRGKKWSVRIIGLESGHVGPPLGFLTFRTEAEATRWCERKNSDRERGFPGEPLTKFEPVELA